MKIGFVQFAPVFGDKQVNFRAVKDLLSDCKADMLVLPELFATGYAFKSAQEVAELAEETGEETTRFLSEISASCNSTIVAGFIEREGLNCYNSALITDPYGLIRTYRKIQLFNKEKLWFSPGNRAPEVIKSGGMKIGIMICFDWAFPEICRTLAIQGAQIIAHPSNLVLPWAQKAMFARCLENRVFAVTANRTGREQRGNDDFTFTGQSQVTGCMGEILASADESTACVRLSDIDPSMADNKSVNAYNDLLNDRRPQLYKP